MDRNEAWDRMWTGALRLEVEQVEHYAALVLKDASRPTWLRRFDPAMADALKRARDNLNATLSLIEQREYAEAAE